MNSRLQYSEASLLAELPDPGSLCRGSHRNRLLRGVQRRLRVSAGCSTRAKRRNRNGRDSNCRWMKVQWQVSVSQSYSFLRRAADGSWPPAINQPRLSLFRRSAFSVRRLSASSLRSFWFSSSNCRRSAISSPADVATTASGCSSLGARFTYERLATGQTYWQLYRAVVRLNKTFDDKTLLSWIRGERAPPRTLTCHLRSWSLLATFLVVRRKSAGKPVAFCCQSRADRSCNFLS